MHPSSGSFLQGVHRYTTAALTCCSAWTHLWIAGGLWLDMYLWKWTFCGSVCWFLPELAGYRRRCCCYYVRPTFCCAKLIVRNEKKLLQKIAKECVGCHGDKWSCKMFPWRA